MDVGSTWAGTYDFTAPQLHAPTSLEQAQQIVADASRIKALGSRHSFHDMADSPGALITLRDVPMPLAIDADSRTATVNSSLTYGELVTELDAAGLALPAMASLPHISVAGAVATATHGSGNTTPCLAGSVTAVELIGADGELRTVRRGDPDFDGTVVGLGALGVVTRLTLSVEPSFQVSQHVVNAIPIRTVQDRFDEITGAAHSVSVFTRWEENVDQVWFKSRSGEGPADLFGGTAATEHQHVILGLDPVNTTRQLGQPGPWYDRLPHFRMGFTPSNGTEIQSEYLLPRENTVAAIDALSAIRDRIRPLLQVTEIRTIAADELWLSAAYGHDTVGLHFTLVRDGDAVRELLPLLEQALAPFQARPHWGKWFTLGRDEIADLYPRMADFRALRERVDPERTFDNDYLQRVIG